MEPVKAVESEGANNEEPAPKAEEAKPDESKPAAEEAAPVVEG